MKTSLKHSDEKPIVTIKTVESRAIHAGTISFVIALIFSYVFFRDGFWPLFGRDSIAFVTSILAVVSIGITYIVAAADTIPRKQRTRMQTTRVYLTILALAFVHSAVGFLLYAGMFFLLGNAFEGLLIDQYASTVIAASMVALASYVTFISASQMNAMRVSVVLAIFLVAGALTSMITAENPYWWEMHFSSLGAGSGISGYAFNITLIIAGIVIVGLSNFITEDFIRLREVNKEHARIRTRAVGTILALIGVFLAMVGYFIYNEHPFLHDNAAAGMAVCFLVLTGALPRLVPTLSRTFYTFSYSIMAVLLISGWLYAGVGYFNLTTLELLAAGLIITWLIVFIRQVGALSVDASNLERQSK